jgi:hypothetical protein
MKMIIALAAAGLVSSLTTIAPTAAHAQKDSACVEKCNRENKTARGGPQQVRSNAGRIGECVAACPPPKRAEQQGNNPRRPAVCPSIVALGGRLDTIPAITP